MIDTQLPTYLQSIFHPLFQHANDLESRLMLIDEMLAVGDEKEIPFLVELEGHEDPKIRNKAHCVKAALQTKLGMITQGERRKLPMNLCFIYEQFDISPNTSDPELDFGVDLEILEK